MYSQQLSGISFYQILLNECKVYGAAREVAEELTQLRRMERDGDIPAAQATLAAAVQKLSRGENTVLYDEAGVPSVMVRIPAIACSDLLEEADASLHPAFLCGKRHIREVWVSKYLNGMVEGRAASLPMGKPCRVRNFEEAAQAVRAKGKGWLLMPFQLRMAIVLKCLGQGIYPSGNTDQGHDYYAKDEMGALTDEGTVLTGSGPLQWTHNGRPEGIWDLSGNLNEWDCGFRLMNGEIQLMEMEALLDPVCDMGVQSSLWKAVDARGAAVPPGTAGTLHYDGCNGVVRLTQHVENTGLGNCAFCNISAEEGLQVPRRLKLWGLYPPRAGLPETAGWRWINTDGEAMPLCGGAYRILDHSGMLFMGVTKQRDVDYPLAGMRCIYIPPEAVEEA